MLTYKLPSAMADLSIGKDFGHSQEINQHHEKQNNPRWYLTALRPF